MKIRYLVLGRAFVIWEAFLSVCAASQPNRGEAAFLKESAADRSRKNNVS